MYLVGKLTERNIYADCATEKCTCEKKCNFIKRICKRLPYVYYFNLVCLIGIVIDCLVWFIGIYF